MPWFERGIKLVCPFIHTACGTVIHFSSQAFPSMAYQAVCHLLVDFIPLPPPSVVLSVLLTHCLSSASGNYTLYASVAYYCYAVESFLYILICQ